MNNDQTPQTVNAPLLKRLLAFLYDLFILFALSMGYWALATVAMHFLLDQPDSRHLSEPQKVFFLSGWILTLAGFYWFFWRRAGQTVGMRAWRLKVVSRDGSPLSHRQILIRILVGPLSLGLFGLGYLWCLIDKNKATWHDLASQTEVLMTPKQGKKKN